MRVVSAIGYSLWLQVIVAQESQAFFIAYYSAAMGSQLNSVGADVYPTVP